MEKHSRNLLIFMFVHIFLWVKDWHMTIEMEFSNMKIGQTKTFIFDAHIHWFLFVLTRH